MPLTVLAINSNCCTALLQGFKAIQQKKNGHLPIFLKFPNQMKALAPKKRWEEL
jgi:hypothetical protein